MAAVARARGGIGAWLWRDSTPSDALAASAIRRPGRRITLGDTPAFIRIPPQDQLTARRGPRPPWSGLSVCGVPTLRDALSCACGRRPDESGRGREEGPRPGGQETTAKLFFCGPQPQG